MASARTDRESMGPVGLRAVLVGCRVCWAEPVRRTMRRPTAFLDALAVHRRKQRDARRSPWRGASGNSKTLGMTAHLGQGRAVFECGGRDWLPCRWRPAWCCLDARRWSGPRAALVPVRLDFSRHAARTRHDRRCAETLSFAAHPGAANAAEPWMTTCGRRMLQLCLPVLRPCPKAERLWMP